MSSRFRAALIWLITLAIPVQGAAASAMLFCGPNHDRTSQALERSAAVAPGHTAHAHGDSGGAASPTTHTDSALVSQVGQADAAEVHPFTKLAKFACGACASCCTSVAISSTTPPMPAPASDEAEIAAPMLSVLPFVTDGLDRPPRTSRL